MGLFIPCAAKVQRILAVDGGLCDRAGGFHAATGRRVFGGLCWFCYIRPVIVPAGEREMFGGKRQPDKRRSGEKPAKPKRPPPAPDELEDAGDIATPEPDRDDEQRGL